METMTKREVARNTTALWAKLKAGQSVYVLENGEPRYKIEAVTGFADPIDQMRHLGLITDASASAEPLRPLTLAKAARSAALADFEAGRER